ncbi:asparagine synthase (glutamine-hydrolyzing) [Actinophytocola algeriensis]|uniref:asparagine synthase (glutamine-hydrolyzing) n=1 Tax=Actinophytocola algeriensis TaxID=1768010 RepID=A0A7W7Q3N8_9PSEU|nr:asparagine synthase (glutamine-hydrolyzing) [Actinophytocola algeriensis]MBB4906206.1 asparagine synthase (glutamine-hydrolyzing) [Actinophytocola algeriensis]MBE1472109.1 asparagine synthase (glutamine-hydrolyzing) [Actinophytocola algeriensis]
MCGIVALHSAADPELGPQMLRRIAHRGPDDEGMVRTDGAWLGHRRLSIVDIEGGAQPLTHDGQYLVSNGEIYNHRALRAGLTVDNVGTGSDNEVILHSLLTRGGAALAGLRGMYAFATAGSRHPFLAARDPVGIKPLYWARIGDTVLFASEMKAFERVHRPWVEPFPPGHYWTPSSGLVRFAHVLPPDPPSSAAGDVAGCSRRVRDALVASVEMQMMGDVPVGVLLSGGLDSSVVAAIAARWYARRGQRLLTFSVGTEGSDDLRAAREVAAHLGTRHFERVYTAGDAVAAVPAVIRAVEHYDPALIHSSVANYLLAELASEHTKVVLTGEGSDEVFAGYEYLHRFAGDDGLLHAELQRIVGLLPSLNLQRCDRTSMAFGLEARVPFLDSGLIALAMTTPIALRRPDFGGCEKFLLRSAFSGWLPDGVLWRRKVQFGAGSGMSEVLMSRMSSTVSEAEFRAARSTVEPRLRNREEMAYYRLWRDALDGIRTSALGQSPVMS